MFTKANFGLRLQRQTAFSTLKCGDTLNIAAYFGDIGACAHTTVVHHVGWAVRTEHGCFLSPTITCLNSREGNAIRQTEAATRDSKHLSQGV